MNANGARFRSQDERQNVPAEKQPRRLPCAHCDAAGVRGDAGPQAPPPEARALLIHRVAVQMETGTATCPPMAAPQGAPTCEPHGRRVSFPEPSLLPAHTDRCAAFLPLAPHPKAPSWGLTDSLRLAHHFGTSAQRPSPLSRVCGKPQCDFTSFQQAL